MDSFILENRFMLLCGQLPRTVVALILSGSVNMKNGMMIKKAIVFFNNPIINIKKAFTCLMFICSYVISFVEISYLPFAAVEKWRKLNIFALPDRSFIGDPEKYVYRKNN